MCVELVHGDLSTHTCKSLCVGVRLQHLPNPFPTVHFPISFGEWGADHSVMLSFFVWHESFFSTPCPHHVRSMKRQLAAQFTAAIGRNHIVHTDCGTLRTQIHNPHSEQSHLNNNEETT